MPVKCALKDGKWWVVEVGSGKKVIGVSGKPVHRKGHSSKVKCELQARAINASLSEKGRI